MAIIGHTQTARRSVWMHRERRHMWKCSYIQLHAPSEHPILKTDAETHLCKTFKSCLAFKVYLVKLLSAKRPTVKGFMMWSVKLSHYYVVLSYWNRIHFIYMDQARSLAVVKSCNKIYLLIKNFINSAPLSFILHHMQLTIICSINTNFNQLKQIIIQKYSFLFES